MRLRSNSHVTGRLFLSTLVSMGWLAPSPAQGEEGNVGAYGTDPQGSPTEPVGSEEFGGSAYGAPTTPEDELADAPPPEKPEVAGTYVRVTAGLSITPGTSHEWSDASNCPSEPTIGFTPTCSTTPPLGLLLDFRLGYSFGVVGLEGFALGTADWSSATLQGLPPLPLPSWLTGMQIGRVGGSFGGGVRLQTLPGPARLSGGLGGGIALRNVFSNFNSTDGSSVAYTAPMMRADLGVVLFNFFTLGVMGWLEFAEDVRIAPNLSGLGLDPYSQAALEQAIGDVTAFQGTQGFVGLFVGLHMGK